MAERFRAVGNPKTFDQHRLRNPITSLGGVIRKIPSKGNIKYKNKVWSNLQVVLWVSNELRHFSCLRGDQHRRNMRRLSLPLRIATIRMFPLLFEYSFQCHIFSPPVLARHSRTEQINSRNGVTVKQACAWPSTSPVPVPRTIIFPSPRRKP